MLGEVVADNRVALGVAVPYVEDSGAGRVRREFRRRGRQRLPRERRVRGQGRVRLRISHREALLFLVGQALAGIAVLPGAVLCLRLCAATVPHPPDQPTLPSLERVAPQLAGEQAGFGWVGSYPKGFQEHRAPPRRGFPCPGADLGRQPTTGPPDYPSTAAVSGLGAQETRRLGFRASPAAWMTLWASAPYTADSHRVSQTFAYKAMLSASSNHISACQPSVRRRGRSPDTRTSARGRGMRQRRRNCQRARRPPTPGGTSRVHRTATRLRLMDSGSTTGRRTVDFGGERRRGLAVARSWGRTSHAEPFGLNGDRRA